VCSPPDDVIMSDTYKKIRFIGYAIPTTPAELIPIGNPNGPGAVAGTYLADPDTETDISNRISILKNAVDTAKAKLPVTETDVINVFVAPEFYYHGTQGPYIYSDPSEDPVAALQQQLAETFNAADYPDWTFICGSVITAMLKDLDTVFESSSTKTRNSVVQNLSQQWLTSFGPLKDVIFDMLVNFIKNCHSYPNCVVRNRVVIVSNISIRSPELDNPTNLMTSEKYYVSNEDFLLYDVNGKQAVTEQMITYQPIDLSAGDVKQNAFDEYAIFRQNGIDPDNPVSNTVTDYGVEICLDHNDTRLRRNIDNNPEVIAGIHVQLIPSCGMQISLPSVAADRNGLVFNCDGQFSLNTAPMGQGVIKEVDCLYANYINENNSSYAAHSQLARVKEPATGSDPNAQGSTNATFETLDVENVTVVQVIAPDNLDDYFAGGPGQVHIYGLDDPFTLYP
jgi:hypothetical protein